MSDRERWIVYPLLFLALGAALRDKLAKQTKAKQIVCEQIYLVDSEGRPAAVLTGQELRFDAAGVGNGFIKANTIDAQALFERGRPAGPKQPSSVTMPLQQLLEMLPGMRIVPQRQPGPPIPPPASEGPEPANPDSLPPPADDEPAGEA